MITSTTMQSVLSRHVPAIDVALRQAVDMGSFSEPLQSSASLASFYGQMQYHLGWVDQRFLLTESHPGKLFRPTLLLLAYEIAGTWEFDDEIRPHSEQPESYLRSALPAAAAIELVHNSTLIHDDIEDGDAVRRHRPTVWNIWGVPHATNTGDGMLTLARLSLWKVLDEGVAHATAALLAVLLDTACLAIFEGQYLDMSFETRLDISLSMYLDMIHRKTAALIACAVEMGGNLATRDAELIQNLRNFGLALGTAFQVRDDVLGIWATDTLGKSPTSDIYRRKKTLPVIYALEHASERDSHLLRAVYEQEMPVRPEQVENIMAILARTESRAYCQAFLALQCEKARAALTQARCSESAISARAFNDMKTIIHYLEAPQQ